jgi:hypothetical protein
MRIVLCLAMAFGLCGCTSSHPTPEPEMAGVDSATKFKAGGYITTVSTITHDGHKFVVCRSSSGVSIIRHPDDK